jgi:tetratricopeptide (TPR) repeat protein
LLVAGLDAYGKGLVVPLEIGSVDDLRNALKKTGRSWVEAGSPDDRARRRRVLTLAALEAAIAAPLSEWQSIRELLEWACQSFRSDEPSDFERTWMLATIAFAESERQDDFLIGGRCPPYSPACNHVRHAMARFPDDPRFRAALVFGRVELNVLTRRPLGYASRLLQATPVFNSLPVSAPLGRSTGDERRLANTLAKVRELQSDSLLAAVARLRIGIVHYELGQFEESRVEIAEALRADLHPFDQYLAHLVLGLGFNSQNRPTEARRAFAAAVSVDPEVISGALELAAHEFRFGSRSEGSAALDRAMAASPARDDPWQRPCPDCAGWSSRLEALRAGVRR